MKRRVLVFRVGDHWFLRHVRDLYETLATKYATKDEPRGIMSAFLTGTNAPFWFRKKQQDDDLNLDFYLKDKESERAFSDKMAKDTELKIYIAGHCASGLDELYSLETSQKLQFTIQVQAIAQKLSKIFKETQVNPTITNPIKLSLICCEAASGGKYSPAFAVRLLQELHHLGYNHILVKAREKSVSAPIFGKKHTDGKKMHFYLDKTAIYEVEKEKDLRNLTLKVIKKCHARTKITSKKFYLKHCLNEIGQLGYTTEAGKIKKLKEIINTAAAHQDAKQYRYGTGWFMRLFDLKSNTEQELLKLKTTLEQREETYQQTKQFSI